MSDSTATRRRRRRILGSIGLGGALVALLCAGRFTCVRALVWPGLLAAECPVGDVVPGVAFTASDLRRGAPGRIAVLPVGWFTWGPADLAERAPLLWGRPNLTLVAPDGGETPLETEDGWAREGPWRNGELVLPPVSDGDYTLRVTVDTLLGSVAEEVRLPLYAPARGHLLTDRPLYEPGQTVRFRGLLVRAADLVPLGERPGVFEVLDPEGLVVFQERAITDALGVAHSDFPLDPDASSGAWTVRLRSGDLVVDQAVEVRPFTLPRFTVEAAAARPWYEPGEVPTAAGAVRFSSGAPVSGAVVALSWRVSGDWPMPTEWAEGGLPTQVVADRSGAFSIQLPPIPEDLLGQATLQARLTATSPAGDVQTGGLSLQLSDTAVLAEAVTELRGGLVEGFNNRVYLRVTQPDGRPLGDADLRVRRTWDPRDPGIEARTDADGVAALQLDPGPPVNVVVPAQPVRRAPQPDPVRRDKAVDLGTLQAPALADQLALDRMLGDLQACALRVTTGAQQVRLGLVVAASGRVEAALPPDTPAGRCLAAAHQGRALGAGAPRVLRLDYALSPPDAPYLAVSVDAALDTPRGLESALADAALGARSCLPPSAPGGELAVRWRSPAGQEGLLLDWLGGGSGAPLPSGARACVRRAFQGLRLDEAPTEEAAGIARLRVKPAPSRVVATPEPTVMLGYALSVAAQVDGEELGEATLRLAPGAVPALRLRADPVLPRPGAQVTIQALRGPDYAGTLPDRLRLQTPAGARLEAPLDAETRTATFTLPEDAQGWYTATLEGAVARVFVAPPAALSVRLSADAARYAPGDTATLTVATEQGGAPVAAGVSLVGVDATLGQLAPLPGPGSLDGLRAQVTTSEPAFGVLDGQALAMGRIAGANAQAATVLRVSQVPTPDAVEVPVSASSAGSFDPVPVLTDRFYAVLAALHAQVRGWEADAPAGEQMTPERMADLWSAARARVAAGGGDPTDAFGRPLRLSALPPDLLALTDPRQVVVDGTRLPEDVERWDRFVAEEDPR